MKYISTLIFGVALVYTWNLVNQVPSIAFETHAGLQTKIAEVIKQSVIEIKPLVKEITIIKITTEPIDDKTVKARFSYKFVEASEESGELAEQQVEGEATLTRSASADPERDLWTMENVKTNTGAMSFKDGIVITPTENEADSEGTTPEVESEAHAEPSTEGAEPAPASGPEATSTPMMSPMPVSPANE